METIQDGVYDAHLIDSEVRLSGNGKPMLCFAWRLDKTGEQIRSYVHLCLKDGSPNTKGIGLVKSWAPEWDGVNLYWFSENLPIASQYDVKLTIANEPSYRDPHNYVSVVKWVNSARGHWGRASAAESEPEADAPVELNREEFRRYLEAVSPTMQDVWRAFRILYAKASQPTLERNWLCLVDMYREGNKDVDQFTAADWQRVLHHMAIL